MDIFFQLNFCTNSRRPEFIDEYSILFIVWETPQVMMEKLTWELKGHPASHQGTESTLNTAGAVNI